MSDQSELELSNPTTTKPKAVRRGRVRKTEHADTNASASEAKQPAADAPAKHEGEPKAQGDRQQGNNRNRQRGKQQRQGGQQQQGDRNRQGQQGQQRKQGGQQQRRSGGTDFQLGRLGFAECQKTEEALEELAKHYDEAKPAIDFNELYAHKLHHLTIEAEDLGIELDGSPNRKRLLTALIEKAHEQQQVIELEGIVECLEHGAAVVYDADNYRLAAHSAFIPRVLFRKWNLKRGQNIRVQVTPGSEGASCPLAIRVISIFGQDPKENLVRVPFDELTAYYPTERLFLETDSTANWDNLSMRSVDLLTPIGLGQRGLIVAPPRTGKTVLMQAMAQAILKNKPSVHLIVLLIDERPEEVTDFKRQVNAEVISSTFDQTADSHVHAAEMVIANARSRVEAGQDVVIILDSITRLARAYNAVMPSSGKILSGGVEANALQGPKRFFGSARNIEEGGSLTIIGSALIETGSRMDEVIFEEFKGTGNMELNLDRGLSEKRIFPAINFEKSGTRKEELLYHPDELQKIYSLRRAMKGVPSLEAMEMFLNRLKKTSTNVDFLMGVNS